MRDHDEVDCDDLRQRREIALRIDRHFLIEMLVHGEIAHRAEEPRSAPSGAARAATSVPITPDAPARFSTIACWPHASLSFWRHDARDDVGSAAGRERDDDAHGFDGELLSDACLAQ